ncbi:MAG: efflux RND transporter periplasmic adaptor subunit [Acidobacteriota bacterium]
MRHACAGAALVGALLLPGCHKAAPDETVTETAVVVEVEAAKTEAVREVFGATGLVAAAPGGDLVVSAPDSARIAEMPRAEGDRVRKGDLLVRFEIPSLTAGAAQARAAIDQAVARVENAKAAAERVDGLFQRGVAARKEVEDGQRELRDATGALQQAQSAASAAQALAGRTTVRAPFDGVIARRWHNPDDLVAAGSGDPILRVINPSRLEIIAAAPLGVLARITVNAPARIINPGGGGPIAAVVIARPAAVEMGSVSASVRLRPGSAAGLTVGMPVQVEIMGAEHGRAVVIPPAAIVREGAETIVMIVGADSKAHRTQVEVGIVTGDAAEILKGIAAGDKVIVRGQNGLPDGAAVTIGS